MENKNPKSESYIVKEAENIIEDYLKKRELSNINKYYKLEGKYNKVRILAILLFITNCISIILNLLTK